MRRLTILFFLFTVFALQGFASSFIGGDVFYRYLSGKKYEVTVALYRDCRGISLNSPPRTVAYNDSFEIVLSLTRVKIEEIKGSACAGGCITNTSSNQGDEKHTFLDTVDFSTGAFALFGTQSKPLVYFGFSQCCRNSAITTYAPGNMFVEAMLNLYYANKYSAKIGFNDFLFPAETYLNCLQTHSTSYRTIPFQSNDSQVYEMVRAKEDKNQEAVYDPYKPLTYYCGNPNITSCQANTNLNPVRGFTFNNSNGNLLTTPSNCSEVGTMVCRVSIYRRNGNTSVLLGYMKRDYNFIVKPSPGERVPYILKNKDYTIKAREQFCVDIPVKDDKDVLQTLSDTVLITLVKVPLYGNLSLIDSNAREKTLHYCWTPSDDDYLNKRVADLSFFADQKRCLIMKKHGLSTSIQFSVIAPDSICQVKVRTFEDRNNNGIKDGTETYSKAKFFMDSKSIYTIYETDSLGQLVLNPFYGKLSFGIPSQLERYSNKSDKVLQTYFDSTYNLDLPYNKRYGIKGKVFVDVNSNCVFDAGDHALANEKLLLRNKQVLAISDKNGDYFIQSQTGSDVLEIKSDAYSANCSASYNIQMKSDTVQMGFDFPLSPKSAFKDLSVELLSKPHLKQNQVLSQNIKVSNKGFKTEKNVLLGLKTSQRLFDFKSSKTTYKYADTLFWIIDSIPANASVLIPFDFRVYKDSFLSNSLMCYSAFLRADSVVDNNQFKICEVFTDTVLAVQCKSSMSTYKVQEQDRRITYKVSFSDKNYNHTYLVLNDSLDASKFDLTSFKLMNNPNGFKVNLIDHVLFAEYYGNVSGGTELGFVYALDLKPGFTQGFKVYNTANWFVDNINKPFSHKVVNETEAAIRIGILNDSNYCLGETISLPVTCLFIPNAKFKVYLSDSLSSFANQTLLLDTLVAKRDNLLFARIPFSIKTGNGYKLKVVSDYPKTQSFETDFTQTLRLNALPSVGLSSNLSNGKICSNDTLKFFATGADSFMYFYNTYQLGQFSKKKTTFTFVPSSNGKLQVATKDLNACLAYSNEIPFSINALPNVKLLSNKELCAGGQLDLDLTGANTYSLYQNSLFLAGNLSSGLRKSPVLNTNTGYKLIGRDANNCVNTDSVTIVVNTLPFKPVIYANKNYLQSNYSAGNQWFMGAIKIDSATAQTFYPPVNGSYAVEYTNSKGCKATSDVYDFRYYSLTSTNYKNQFNIYPNPIAKQGRLFFEEPVIGSIQIYNALGQKIFEQNASSVGVSFIVLDLNTTGLYWIKLGREGVYSFLVE
jgi:hypothetical protein